MGEVWKVTITDSLNRFLEKVLIFLPNLLAMITILVVGFLIAWIFKKLLFRFLKAIQFDRVSRQWGLADVLSKGGMTYSPANLLSRFFYWVIVFVTLILGINALEVAATQNLIAQFFNYLPHLFAAVLILVIGYLIAIFLGQATLIAAVNAQMESAKLLSRSGPMVPHRFFRDHGPLSIGHCRKGDHCCLLRYLRRNGSCPRHRLRMGREGIGQGVS